MKTATLSRRLLAGVAGLAVGLGGLIAVSTPAQAVIPNPEAKVHIVDTCAGVDIKIDGNGTNRGWRILVDGEVRYPEGASHGDIPQSDPPWGLWIGPDDHPFTTHIPADEAKKVKVEWWRGSQSTWATDEVDTKYTGAGPGKHDWSNPGWPGKDCEGPKVVVFKDCEGKVTVTIHGNDTRRTWKVDGVQKFIEFGETKTFDAESKDVVIKWKHGHNWVEADEKYVHRKKERDCPTPPPPGDEEDNGKKDDEEEDNGGAGELPKTGAQTALIAGGALVMLTLGGAMYVMARRRRVSFTA